MSQPGQRVEPDEPEYAAMPAEHSMSLGWSG
jgi:hypothetical protein